MKTAPANQTETLTFLSDDVCSADALRARLKEAVRWADIHLGWAQNARALPNYLVSPHLVRDPDEIAYRKEVHELDSVSASKRVGRVCAFGLVHDPRLSNEAREILAVCLPLERVSAELRAVASHIALRVAQGCEVEPPAPPAECMDERAALELIERAEQALAPKVSNISKRRVAAQKAA